MRVISKVFNNNVVSVVDRGSGEEMILVGAGLGYLAKRGQQVDDERVEKEFRLTGSNRDGMSRILVDLPYDILKLTAAIAVYLRAAHGIELPATVEIALGDHLWQSIRRLDDGIPLYNSMLWETKATYPQEFAVALQILDVVVEQMGRRLPLDEAGFITLHLVNAGLVTDAGHAYTLGRALRDILAIVEQELQIPADADSPSLARFLTHLKFVIQRLTQRRLFTGGFAEIFEARRSDDPDGYRCAQVIGTYLQDTFATKISDEELMYLMIHLARLRADLADQARLAPPSPAPTTEEVSRA
jgi:beta-glucoside operon transcriptional antiterminator